MLTARVERVDRIAGLDAGTDDHQIKPFEMTELFTRIRALFECLADHSGRIVSKDRIAGTLYGVGSDIEANGVEQLILRLRRERAGGGVTIRTARGLGCLMKDAPE